MNKTLDKQLMTAELLPDGRPKRQVRSFVLRQGRLTKGQKETIDATWHLFGIDYDDKNQLDFSKLFGNPNPTTLEIGFGMGASLAEMAKNSPERNFIGIEVHKPGVGACLMQIEKESLQNVRVMCHDAVEVLTNMIADDSLDCVQVFFPDPWHKSKHNKRRIIQPEFVDLLQKKLKENGIIHLATDWQNYAEYMLEVMKYAKNLINLSSDDTYIDRPIDRPMTKFEKRGINLGHGVWDLKFRKLSKVSL